MLAENPLPFFDLPNRENQKRCYQAEQSDYGKKSEHDVLFPLRRTHALDARIPDGFKTALQSCLKYIANQSIERMVGRATFGIVDELISYRIILSSGFPARPLGKIQKPSQNAGVK